MPPRVGGLSRDVLYYHYPTWNAGGFPIAGAMSRAEKLQQLLVGICTIIFMAWIISQMVEAGLPYLIEVPLRYYLRGLGY